MLALLRRSALVAVALLAWEACARSGAFHPILFPTLASIGRELAAHKRSAPRTRRTVKRATARRMTAKRVRKTTAKARKKPAARKRASGGGRR